MLLYYFANFLPKNFDKSLNSDPLLAVEN